MTDEDEVEQLAVVIGLVQVSPHVRMRNLQIARAILESQWLREHDEQVKNSPRKIVLKNTESSPSVVYYNQ